jgi:hypothetical protein
MKLQFTLVKNDGEVIPLKFEVTDELVQDCKCIMGVDSEQLLWEVIRESVTLELKEMGS